MPKIDGDELEILSAYENGQLSSVAAKAELARYMAAARTTGIKVKALEDDMPWQSDRRLPAKRSEVEP